MGRRGPKPAWSYAGQRFDHLVVFDVIYGGPRGRAEVVVRCDCFLTETTTIGALLNDGHKEIHPYCHLQWRKRQKAVKAKERRKEKKKKSERRKRRQEALKGYMEGPLRGWLLSRLGEKESSK